MREKINNLPRFLVVAQDPTGWRQNSTPHAAFEPVVHETVRLADVFAVLDGETGERSPQ